MNKPYRLMSWQDDAIRELIDLLNSTSNGLFESPADLSECLVRSAEAIRLVLDPDEFCDQLPQLCHGITTLYFALQLAATELCTLRQAMPGCHGEVVDRWLTSAIDTVSTTRGDQQRDVIAGTLGRLNRLRAQTTTQLVEVNLTPDGDRQLCQDPTAPDTLFDSYYPLATTEQIADILADLDIGQSDDRPQAQPPAPPA